MCIWGLSPRRLAVVAFSFLLLASGARAHVLRTITIDGNLEDWTEVLLDREQKVSDPSAAQGDPDMPPQSQRDERGAAFTWDATKLYFWFSRTGSGTNSFNAVFYIDRGHDGFLHATDRIAIFKFSGSSFQSLDLYAYNDGGTPDAIPGDGGTPAGTTGALLGTTGGTAQGEPDGIRFEASLTWAALGIPAGTPMFIHPSIYTNTNLPGGVQDNCDNLDTKLVGVELTPGTTKGAPPGGTASFPHVVTNAGTASDILDLMTRTRLGFSVSIHTDPDGDGDPSDGVLASFDSNGDGDSTDPLDIAPPPALDANANGLPDGWTMAAGSSRNWVVRVGVPVREPLGNQELVRLIAASDYKPNVRREALDGVVVGLITITPPRETAIVRGGTGRMAHDVCNYSGLARVIDLTLSSSQGNTLVAWSDPDSDGDPSDGAPLVDSDADGQVDAGSVSDGACVGIVVQDSVPAGATPGTIDTVEVGIQDGAIVSSVTDLVHVAASAVAVEPDRSLKAQRGKTVYPAHVAANAESVPDSFALGVTSSLGSQVSVLSDPDGNSQPGDSTPVTSTGTLAPGAVFPLLARVRLPNTAVHGDVDSVIVTASSPSGSDDAIDTITVAGTLTYADPLLARPATEFFGQCSIIYVLSFRSGGGTFRFQWLDPLGVVRRNSPDISPYADGSLDDFYDLGASPALGTWTIKLQQRSGASYVDVGAAGTTTFDALDLVTGGARVRELSTGSDIYLLAGEALHGYADLDNPTYVDILGSRIEYVAFHDTNVDGQLTAGEDYVRYDGSVAAWAAGLLTASRTAVDVYAYERFGDTFDTAPVTYTQIGQWNLQAQWFASCGFLLATEMTTFTVGCQPPPTFAGIVSAVDIDPCAHTGILLSWDAASSWGLGTSGVYDVYRSTTPGFTPGPANLLALGITVPFYVDATALPGVAYSYVVQAESNVRCSDGPNNNGLLDGNFAHSESTDDDAGVVPIGSFTFSQPACLDGGPATVSFSDTSIGPAQAWEWDFDADGIVDSLAANPTHDFATPGLHDVTLRVTNPCGTATVTLQVRVSVPPVASMVVDIIEGCAGGSVGFDGLPSSALPPATLVAWSWDYDGDGVEDASGASPAPHSFAAQGSYPVTLTVTDSLGCVGSTTTDVVIHAAMSVSIPPPAIDPCTGAVNASATITGGDGSFSYVWDVLTGDASGGAAGTLAPGSYTVTVDVTDTSGCSATGSANFVVPLPPSAAYSWIVTYLGPGQYRADLSGSGADGLGPYTFSWDVGDDGTEDGTGAVFALAMAANETLPVRLTITDANGCVADVLRMVSSDGCPADTPISLLMVSKTAAGGLRFTWQPSVHACHARYDVLEAATSRPLDGRNGTWLDDPPFTSLRLEDADGSDGNEQLILADPRPDQDRYFLVRDGGTDGTWGPVESYGSTGVTTR